MNIFLVIETTVFIMNLFIREKKDFLRVGHKQAAALLAKPNCLLYTVVEMFMSFLSNER